MAHNGTFKPRVCQQTVNTFGNAPDSTQTADQPAPRAPRFSEVRRPTPPALRRAPAPFVRRGRTAGGGRRTPHTATAPGSRAPRARTCPACSPQVGPRGRRLPAVAGLASPASTAPALPVRADEQPPGFPPPTTLRSAPPFSFPPLDSSFPRFAAPVPKRPGVIPPPTMFSPKEGHRRGDADGSISCSQNAAPSGSVGSVGGDPGGPRRRAPRPEQPRRSEPTAAPQDAVTG